MTLIKHTKTTSTGGTTVAGVIDSASRNGCSDGSAKDSDTEASAVSVCASTRDSLNDGVTYHIS